MQAIVSYIIIPFLDNLNEIETVVDLFKIKNIDNTKISLVNCNIHNFIWDATKRTRFRLNKLILNDEYDIPSLNEYLIYLERYTYIRYWWS